MRNKLRLLGMSVFVPAALSAQQFIANGGFESGSLSSWAAYFAPGSSPAAGRYYASNSTSSPVSGYTTPGAHSGSFYAVSDQTGPGAGALYQTFTVGGPLASATLTFSLFVQDQSGLGPLGDTEDYGFGGGPNQHGTVDLLSGDISGDPLGGTVLANFFSGAGPTGWTTYSFDVSSYLSPGTYTLRFAEADNESYFQMGVDDVSIRGPADVVPEPGTLSLFGFGAVGLAGFRRRRRRA